MEKIIDFEKCTGCHACHNACPVHCISMKANEEGFLYPVIDTEKCVDCGKCKSVCPVLNEYRGNPKGKAYACINNDEFVRMQSSSGGVFSLLAKYILSCNGVVFGAAFDDDLSVHHVEISNINDLGKLYGSKYLQSRIEDTYEAAKAYLENGKIVMFAGTPCQISGLRVYLGKDYDNLYTQDLICHGVPSPAVWQAYLRFCEKNVGASTRKAFFRHKKHGWKRYSVQLSFDNSIEYIQLFFKDLYMRSFLSDICLRPACYSCHSKSVERESDITLADFWGIENVCPEFFDDKGTSLVLVNSLKGKSLFDEISSQMKYKEVNIDEALKFNPSAYRAVVKPKNRDRFMKMIFEYPFDYAVRKCIPAQRFRRFLSRGKRLLYEIIRG